VGPAGGPRVYRQGGGWVLGNAGAIFFKEASANKGGVTSSSLEVLAALALDDSEFSKNMAVSDIKRPPAFYKEYVEEIQRRTGWHVETHRLELFGRCPSCLADTGDGVL